MSSPETGPLPDDSWQELKAATKNWADLFVDEIYGDQSPLTPPKPQSRWQKIRQLPEGTSIRDCLIALGIGLTEAVVAFIQTSPKS